MADGATQLDGAMPITEFNTEYEESLDDTDYTTIGGYVFGQLGRLPRVGDRVAAGAREPRWRRWTAAGWPAASCPTARARKPRRRAQSPRH